MYNKGKGIICRSKGDLHGVQYIIKNLQEICWCPHKSGMITLVLLIIPDF